MGRVAPSGRRTLGVGSGIGEPAVGRRRPPGLTLRVFGEVFAILALGSSSSSRAHARPVFVSGLELTTS